MTNSEKRAWLDWAVEIGFLKINTNEFVTIYENDIGWQVGGIDQEDDFFIENGLWGFLKTPALAEGIQKILTGSKRQPQVTYCAKIRVRKTPTLRKWANQKKGISFQWLVP